MNREWLASVLLVGLLGTTACEPETIEIGSNNAAADEQQPEPVNMETAELPPMIERSAAYRCTDGDALYVDVLTDGNAVMVRDSRADIPLRLTRKDSGEPFAGEDRTLSGTGSEVRYSAPARPGQICQEAHV